MLLQHLLLGLFLILGQFARVTAFALGADTGIDEAGAQRFDLLARCGAHVVTFDDRPQPACGRQCLETGDTGADDQYFRRPDSAGRRGQHREKLVQRIGRDQHCLVAGNSRL